MLFCELDGRVLRGMQFGVLVGVPHARRHAVWGAGDGWVLGHVVWGWVVALRDWRPGAGGCWWMLLCELDGRAGIQLGLLVEVPLCEIDGRVLGGHAVWGVGGRAVLRE